MAIAGSALFAQVLEGKNVQKRNSTEQAICEDHTAIDRPSLEECYLQQAPGDQRHGQISKIEENTTLYCASAGPHAIPVPAALARDDFPSPST
jgi:hypothetical protein